MIARTALLLTAIALFPGMAQAQAYYSMTSLQAESKLFQKVANSSQKNNEKIQREVVTTGRALDSFGEALLAAKAITETAPEACTTRQAELATQFEADWKTVNEFVDALVTDTDAAFLAALDRHMTALEEKLGVKLEQCDPGGVLGAAMGGSSCEGTDFTPQLISAIDGDEELAAAVEELTGRSWPAPKPSKVAMAVVDISTGADLTGDASFFSPDNVLREAEGYQPLYEALESAYAMSKTELDRGSQSYQANRSLLAMEWEALNEEERAAREKELEDELATLKKASEVLTDWRAQASSEVLATVWEQTRSMESKIRKEYSIAALGVCLQSADLGGCDGTDQSYEVKKYMSKQKKILKAVEKAAEEISGPELGL